MILLIAAAVAIPAPAQKALITGAETRGNCSDLVCRALDAQKRGDDQAAAEDFEEAAKSSSDKDPKTARLYAAAGNLWIAANQPAKAAFDLDKAVQLPGLEGEQRGEALLDRARAAEAENDLTTAHARLADAGATISADPFYWYFSASLALRENDLATARLAVEHALKLAPNDPAILFEAGHVADSSGDDETARTYWQRATAADPKGPVGRDAAKALEMLGVTPTLKTDASPGSRTAQPKS